MLVWTIFLDELILERQIAKTVARSRRSGTSPSLDQGMVSPHRGRATLVTAKVAKTIAATRSRRKKIGRFATGLRYGAIGRGICLKSSLFKLRQAPKRRQRMLRNDRGAFFRLRFQAASRGYGKVQRCLFHRARLYSPDVGNPLRRSLARCAFGYFYRIIKVARSRRSGTSPSLDKEMFPPSGAGSFCNAAKRTKNAARLASPGSASLPAKYAIR